MPYKTKELTQQYNKIYYEELKMINPEKYEEIKQKAREQSKKQYEKKRLEMNIQDKPKRKYTKRIITKPEEINELQDIQAKEVSLDFVNENKDNNKTEFYDETEQIKNIIYETPECKVQ
jgi:hypothetical protein